MANWFVSSDGQPPQRWQDTFPGAHAVKRELFQPGLVPEGAVVWVLDEAVQRANTLSIVRRCGAEHPVAVLSTQPQDANALQFFKVGARAYCHALAAPSLLRKVENVLRRGGYWMSETILATLAGQVGELLAGNDSAATLNGQLTPRELEVAQAVVAGATNREVAERLDISERTVKAHLTSIFDKLDVRDRMQLAVHMNRPQSPG